MYPCVCVGLLIIYLTNLQQHAEMEFEKLHM